MAQMSWRSSDELHDRVRRAAQQQGRSMNDYLNAVLDAATDPDLAGSEAERLRERLASAGLLIVTDRGGRRPNQRSVAKARAAAGQGTPLSEFVTAGRR